jgi:3',5'-cyclic AMP phosphodiesterase CpdA
MSGHRIVWADDHWNTDGRFADNRRTLEEIASDIEARLREQDVVVEWICEASASNALAAIQRPGADVRLLILDFDFDDPTKGSAASSARAPAGAAPGGGYDWRDIVVPAQQRGIPFVLFTSYLGDALVDPSFPKTSLNIGMYGKHKRADVEAFVKRVVDFFRAPQFRLLHLSDLHWDGRAEGEAEREQGAIFDALEVRLGAEQQVRPVDAVCITGDLAYHHPAEDLPDVRRRINGILAATVGRGNPDRLLIVPGNHDLAWKEPFEKKELERRPWQGYLDLYQEIYFGQKHICARMEAWNTVEGRFDLSARKDALRWHVQLRDPPLNVLGLVSPSESPDLQGLGEVSQAQLQWIKAAWSAPPAFGEVRVALLHHNLFSVISLSRHDEKTLVQRAGEVVHALTRGHGHLVLNGHTHTSNLLSHRAARSSMRGLATAGHLTAVSAGTTGGLHLAGDRQRSYNVLDFSAADADTGRRSLSVRTFLYDSVSREWEAAVPYEPDWLQI